MLPSWFTDTVTVIRPVMVEKRGSMVPDWANPQTFTVDGCEFQARTTAREFPGRALQVADGAVLFAPFDADIKAGDRLEIYGQTYEIAGAPIPVKGATRNLAHLEIPLSAWSG